MAKEDLSVDELKAKISELTTENDALKNKIENLKERVIDTAKPHGEETAVSAEVVAASTKSLCIIVVGASGDLAKKKTFPALFSLYCHGLLPPDVIIAGYSRSQLEDAAFKERISEKFKTGKSNDESDSDDFAKKKTEFLKRCFYFAGQYDSDQDFGKFHEIILQWEAKKENTTGGNRIFYMAIPPTLFSVTGKSSLCAQSKNGWNRVIVEKPFGRDSETSAKLGRELGFLFKEDQIYRIDHYLGKEMVQNLMVLRFANAVFEPLWNRQSIKCVIITFKEPFGTKGRGGYFDKFGIIRDVMQNHLLQILSLIAMEPPVTMSAEDVRDEKVKLLRCISALKLEDLVIGQYGADPAGSEPGYIENDDVPDDSVTPTFATAVLHINNYRWKGCPFILKCGKALDTRKAEVRIQFKKPPADLFSDLSPNELVLRVQPDEAVYLKMSMKRPGLKGGVAHSELDLSYSDRFGVGEEKEMNLPEAYERLIYDVVRGDHNLFVRSDELVAAWKIFTPVLHQIEEQKIKPVQYKFGSRGPAESDALIAKWGYERTVNYSWQAPR